MSHMFKKEPLALRRGRRVLATLDLEIGQTYNDTLNLLQNGLHDPARIETLNPVLHQLAEVGRAIQESRIDIKLEELDRVHTHLEGWACEAIRQLQSEPNSHVYSRRLLTQAMQSLVWAEMEFTLLLQKPGNEPSEDSPKEIRIPSDLLYQCYQNLFPAERMLAVSGRMRGKQVELGAVFDVTGIASAGHVRADTQKLIQALIAMSNTDTFLAAWFHSHPGIGPLSTCPSGIDQRQHRDWLQDYSANLLSGIFVQDRYFRLWGTGLEQGKIRVDLQGPGVISVKGEPHVYQIVTS